MKKILKGFGAWLFTTVLAAMAGVYVYNMIITPSKWGLLVCFLAAGFCLFLVGVMWYCAGKLIENDKEDKD